MLKSKKNISVKAIFAFVFYLLIPLIAISIILTSYPELSKDRFIRIVYWIVPISIMIIVISQISLRYKRGDDRRFILNIFYVVMTIVWVYGFLGGRLVITETWLEYEFSIHVWKYILLIIIAALVNIIYYTLEWRVYKEDPSNNCYNEKSVRPYFSNRFSNV